MVTVNQLKHPIFAYLGIYETEFHAGVTQVTTLQFCNIKIGWVTHTFGVNDKPFPLEGKRWIPATRLLFTMKMIPRATSRIEKQIRDCRVGGCERLKRLRKAFRFRLKRV